MKVTQEMQYFKELTRKTRYIRSNTHEKICSRARHEFFRQGKTVIHYRI